MRIFEKFDSWVQNGPFSPVDLGIYRIVFAVGTLCLVPKIQWLAEYPDALYSAPLGPFRLLDGFPDANILAGFEFLRTLALVLLALGIWTKWSGIASALLLLVTYGLTYTLGKIDHTILLVVTPLVLSFSHWGDKFSVDALLRKRSPRTTPQWPLRYLALAIGLSFFVAAAMKLGTGWLDPSTQAVRGFAVQYYVSQGRTEWLAGWMSGFEIRPVWEVLDWSTVIFEFALLAAVPWWRAFRIVLSFAAFFHLGVFLIMNITFAHNLIPYGAFVAWGVVAVLSKTFVRRFTASTTFDRLGARSQSGSAVMGIAILSALGLSIIFWLTASGSAALANFVNLLTLFGGALIAVVYLFLQLRRVVGNVRRSPATR